MKKLKTSLIHFKSLNNPLFFRNMTESFNAFMHQFVPTEEKAYSKVTIVGAGQVGMAIAYSILQQVVFFIVYLNFIGYCR